MNEPTPTIVRTPDGRDLEVLASGPEDGVPVVFHHGTPSAAVPDPAFTTAAAERGLRLVVCSRPGYGGSTPRPDGAVRGTVADDVADVVTVLDHLGAGRFLTAGWSGGGPRSLACAALLPDRCLAAACGVGLAPLAEFDGDIRTGMAEENVEELTAALAGPDELAPVLERFGADLFSVTGEQVAESLGGLAPPVDRAALTGDLAEVFAAGFRASGRQGTVGWLHDDLALLRPWGFAMADIRVPVSVWHGSEDTMVPIAHGRWLAAHIPGARARLQDGEGHLSLFTSMPRILDDLLDLAGLA